MLTLRSTRGARPRFVALSAAPTVAVIGGGSMYIAPTVYPHSMPGIVVVGLVWFGSSPPSYNSRSHTPR